MVVVEHLLAEVVVAVGVFAGTNVDDLVILTVLFLASRASGRPKVSEIWVGQYVGIATLLAASSGAALGMMLVPDEWIGLLGLVPVALGTWGMMKAVRAHRRREHESEPAATAVSGVLSVAVLTIANGADNVSVYTPMFRTIGLPQSAVTAAVFVVMIAGWCAAGSWLSSHKRPIALVERYGHWLVPAVFIVVGVFIVIDSGVAEHLARALR